MDERKRRRMRCDRCGQDLKAKWIKISLNKKRLVLTCGCKSKSESKSSFSIHKYKEPTAFGYDKETGQPIALDKRGKRIDPKDTRYDFNKDPHGWRAVGMKVRDKDQCGRPQ